MFIFILIFLSGCATVPVNKIEPTVLSFDINAPSPEVFSAIKKVVAKYKNYQIVKEDQIQAMVIITSRHNPIVKGGKALGSILSGCRVTEEYEFRAIPVGKQSQLVISMLILVHRPAFVETLPVRNKPAYQDMLDIAQEIKTMVENQ